MEYAAGFNILIADDSKITRISLIRIIEIIRIPVYKFYEAQNGKEALKILYENNIDFIMLDIRMPIMDGIEFVKTIKSNEKLSQIPIIIITSFGSESDLKELMKMGVNSFINKPFDPPEIRQIINQLSQTTNDYDNLYFKSIQKVIEKTFFSLASKVSDSDIPDIIDGSDKKQFYSIIYHINGDIIGNIEYYIPTDLAKRLLSYVLAGDDKIKNYTNELIEDNITEFCDITVGYFFTNYFPYYNNKISFSQKQYEKFDSFRILKDIGKWNAVRIEDYSFFYKLDLNVNFTS
ncbi:MAG: response regulator [Spirochaetota bacterium]|nr:response regulator [Spirochaetota bacterium]